MSGEDPAVTLFLPTWNAGPEFPAILAAMLGQELDRPFETVVIDSGSSDGTVEFLERQPVRLTRIPNSEFNHGLTRNRGVALARGEIVVLSVQDAMPADAHWMQRLVDCFDDPKVAGAFGRQLPRADANPFIKARLRSWVAGNDEPSVQSLSGREELESLAPLARLQRIAFDNVSSAVRKSVMAEIPFRERSFGEDIDWSRRALLAGYRTVYEPRARVVHSHNNSAWYELKRIYADHANLNETLGVHTIPTFTLCVECIFRQALHYLRVVENEPELAPFARMLWCLRAFPYSFAENLGQFLGAASVTGLRERRVFPRFVDWALRRGV